jgi:hypothetical protein
MQSGFGRAILQAAVPEVCLSDVVVLALANSLPVL